ncbi:putative carboxylesterase 2 [Apostasia shenzhenica]|uniref:Putative carboxylesterase 2 n=1 Tax=Apostasia shenzhenica TaxID=1088818 RepID=A0A2I0A3K8_9ASPA|nr:putative carboxylesterase 2 [Apostasia shenzhenica]
MSTSTGAGFVPPAPGEEVELELPGFFRLYRSGRFDRYVGLDKLPASLEPETGVVSKDVTVDLSTGVTARLYLPSLADGDSTKKLPVLVYFHGGAFCLESAASPIYHRHLNTLAFITPVLAVSVDYRLAPEHPLPVAYEDSWATLRWVFSLADPWLAEHGDPKRIFLAGDSAGGNIAHQLALRAGTRPEGEGIAIKGVALIHPYFWGSAPLGAEPTDTGLRGLMEQIWKFLCPETSGLDDRRINPLADGGRSLAELGCERVLVSVAEKDHLRHRGKAYFEKLKASGWPGEAELVETADAEHVFHLFYPETEEGREMHKALADFFSKE